MRIIIEGREIDSPLRGRIHFRRLLSSNNFFLQFGGGPYMLRQSPDAYSAILFRSEKAPKL